MVRTLSRAITNLKLSTRLRICHLSSLSAALLSICVLFSLFLLQHSHLANTHRPNVAAASQERQTRLTNAIKLWNPYQDMPSEIARSAASCPPEDAAVAALQVHGVPNIVVDVGANGGHPVTVSALRANAKAVLAVEPDIRNIERLQHQRTRSNSNITKYVIVHGAAGATSQTMHMRFHQSRNDYGGFTSLDPNKNDVYTQQVQVKPVDVMLDELKVQGPVTLLKTDTQGYETQVIIGAEKSFYANRVQALLVEFDPKLLQTRANALQLLRQIVAYGLKCVHLAFSGRITKLPLVPTFPRLPLSNSSIYAFYDFVYENTGWTDLFCLLPPS